MTVKCDFKRVRMIERVEWVLGHSWEYTAAGKKIMEHIEQAMKDGLAVTYNEIPEETAIYADISIRS